MEADRRIIRVQGFCHVVSNGVFTYYRPTVKGEFIGMALHARHPLPIAQTNPRSPVSEAYRTIRTNLQFAGVAENTQVILITSSQSGEGKTSLASNLALVTAQAGQRVLLIDADMRKPQVHHRFQISNLDGLSSVLIRERTLKDVVVAAQTPNLYLMPSGPIPPNPSEMLSSRSMRELVESCRKEFDYIFIDSSPVLAVADALVLTGISDGTLFVVDARQTNRNMARQAVRALQQVKARILGVVLNRVTKDSGDTYYYSSYGYYAAGDSVGV